MTAEPTHRRPVVIGPRRWARCAGCGLTVYVPKLDRALGVCPECGHHHRLGAAVRLRRLLDPGSFVPSPERIAGTDPLGFADRVPYTARLATARTRTGLDDAVVAGRGTLGRHPVVVAAMDFSFMGGSMGSAVGETITRAAETALATRTPLLLLAASGGARMQEGALSLMQMAKTAQAMQRCRRSGILTVSVLTDPVFGGVTASFATLADLVVAEPGALIGFAGPRVIESATGRPLPPGFQTAEYLLEHGMLDRVEPRLTLRPLLTRVLSLHRAATPDRGHGAETPSWESVPALDRPPNSRRRSPWQTVRAARDTRRPTTLDYIHLMCDDFVELHGDRCHGDDPAIVGGLASLGPRNVMVIGHQKGHDTAELVARNFGMPHPEGYRKVLRLARLAERLRLPVVTLVDTQGAAPGIGAEQRGQGQAIAETLAGLAELTVPVVATITGEGGSGGALALALADRVLMLGNAWYSVISPESCSVILLGDASRAETMAARLRLTAPELLRLRVIDRILPEPSGGAQSSPAAMADTLRAAVLDTLDELSGLAPGDLITRRHQRFRRLGEVTHA
ncbi:acetyl-CoA carboxylase carboxyltransferase subunit alpha [Thermomonospora umbrina]|uniref:Multifunctional fusion protein n=1 Tax=Thermomonospora umbrina TaxID=111806 RepID=A0A3D9SPN6_9ACTN|nr:acetyl-CoA carboxylase carboxyltransferase subunit alpha [Thermomonospora umbrina]REE97577.1 acetyl-CoA carboxylase carboxyl transferase subunit beta [Thermomonospora umbrina]